MSTTTLTKMSISKFLESREAFLNAMNSVADGNDCELTTGINNGYVIAKLTVNDKIMPAAGWSVSDKSLDLGLAFLMAKTHGDVISFTAPHKADVLLIPNTNEKFDQLTHNKDI
jgi:hypothetical protein